MEQSQTPPPHDGQLGKPLDCATPAMGCVGSKGARGGFWEKGDLWGLDSGRAWLYKRPGWKAQAAAGARALCLCPAGPGGAAAAAEEETEEPGICPAQPEEAHGQGGRPAPGADSALPSPPALPSQPPLPTHLWADPHTAVSKHGETALSSAAESSPPSQGSC